MTKNFETGHIKWLEVHNFMTFDHVKIDFSDRINLVVGPNGSGKSSVVTALNLGLNGSPSALGKQGKPAQFVKLGRSFARIKTALHVGEQLLGNPFFELKRFSEAVVERTLFASPKKKNAQEHEWKLNSVPVSANRVAELLAALHIDVSSLCQFLAQDRVAELSRLSPEALLLQFEQDVLTNPQVFANDCANNLVAARFHDCRDLATFHRLLAEAQNQLLGVRAQVRQFESELKHNEEQMRLLQQDVDNEKAAANLRSLLLQLEKLLLFSKTADLNARQDELEKNYRNTEDQLYSLEKAKTKTSKKLAKVEQDLKKQAAKKKGNKKTDEKNKKLLQTLVKEVVTNREDRTAFYRDLGACFADAVGLEQKESAFREQLEQARRRLASAEKDESALSLLRAAAQATKTEVLQLERTKATFIHKKLAAEHKLQSTSALLVKETDLAMAHEKQLVNKKFRAVFRTADQLELFHLVESKRPQFRGKVYGPLVHWLKTTTPIAATMLETAVSTALKYAYVCSTPEDANLIHLAAEYKKLPVSVVVQSSETRPCSRTGSLSFLQKNGIACWLDDYVRAPELVLACLVDQTPVYKVAVALQELTPAQLRAVLKTDNAASEKATHVYTPRHSYAVVFSAHAPFRSSVAALPRKTVVSYLFDDEQSCKHLHVSVNATADQRREAVVQLQTEVAKLTADTDRLVTDRLAPLRRKLEEQTAQLKAYKQAKFEVAEHSANLCLAAELKANLLTGAVAVLHTSQPVQRLALLQQLSDCVHAFFSKSALASEVLEVKTAGMRKCVVALQEELAEIREATNRTKKDAKEYFAIKTALEQEIKVAKTALGANTVQIDAAVADKYTHLSTEVLEKETLLLRKRMAFIAFDEENLEQFARSERKAASLKSSVVERMQWLASESNALNYFYEHYCVQTRKVVSELDRSFAVLFERITGKEGRGSVKLCEDTRVENFRLEVWVKFRSSDNLKVLRSVIQSGGEKALSTMVFLLAIQELSFAPFRVVDEINQGLDARNERALFALLKENVRHTLVEKQAARVQYFVVTPKLLPGLDYADLVTVHFVFNGPLIGSLDVFQLEKFLNSWSPPTKENVSRSKPLLSVKKATSVRTKSAASAQPFKTSFPALGKFISRNTKKFKTEESTAKPASEPEDVSAESVSEHDTVETIELSDSN